MSSSRNGYCLWCGEDVSVYAYEAYSENIMWERCKSQRCSGNRVDVKTDNQGFVLEPPNMRGKYIFARKKLGR